MTPGWHIVHGSSWMDVCLGCVQGAAEEAGTAERGAAGEPAADEDESTSSYKGTIPLPAAQSEPPPACHLLKQRQPCPEAEPAPVISSGDP
jgi:hypothetical protein